MREKLQRFMTGRYGADELGRTLNIVVLVSLVVSMFSGLLPVLSVFYWFGIALMIYNCFQALRGESAVSEQALQSSCEAGSVEEALRTERYLPLFQVSWMQAESAGAEGKR